MSTLGDKLATREARLHAWMGPVHVVFRPGTEYDFSALVKHFWMETTGKQLSYQKKRIKIEEASQTVGLGRNGDWAGVVGTCLGSPTRGRHRGPGEEISRGKKQARFYGALWTSP